eukprot:TRINITY_DN16079_c0_g2_i1.p1 TRINITY_DN16079_c0_g2~~TRINITY_DN16079_c0_g2_i1.p1  ORF type:complete len:224 (+),score=45.46 TRINITY_DN16079_c0_g2_i1:303-974(+)
MTGASLLVAAVALLALAVTASAQGCTPAAPNPCYNAPGTASICCPGACGPSTGDGGVTATCAGTPPPATPAPTPSPTSGQPGTIYQVFDFSSDEMNCANQAAAPGVGAKFGDICLYKGPILAADLKTTIGMYVESDTTFFFGNGTDFLTAASTFYFTTAPPVGSVDAISTYGDVSTEATELAIIGGTGKYRGAHGYVVGGLALDLSPKADGSILAIPKEFHLF